MDNNHKEIIKELVDITIHAHLSKIEKHHKIRHQKQEVRIADLTKMVVELYKMHNKELEVSDHRRREYKKYNNEISKHLLQLTKAVEKKGKIR